MKEWKFTFFDYFKLNVIAFVVFVFDYFAFHFGLVQLVSDYFHQPNDDKLETRTIRIVVKYSVAVLIFGASKRRRFHTLIKWYDRVGHWGLVKQTKTYMRTKLKLKFTWINGAQMIVKSVEIFEKVFRCRAEYRKYFIKARLDAKLEKKLSE